MSSRNRSGFLGLCRAVQHHYDQESPPMGAQLIHVCLCIVKKKKARHRDKVIVVVVVVAKEVDV